MAYKDIAYSRGEYRKVASETKKLWEKIVKPHYDQLPPEVKYRLFGPLRGIFGVGSSKPLGSPKTLREAVANSHKLVRGSYYYLFRNVDFRDSHRSLLGVAKFLDDALSVMNLRLKDVAQLEKLLNEAARSQIPVSGKGDAFDKRLLVNGALGSMHAWLLLKRAELSKRGKA